MVRQATILIFKLMNKQIVIYKLMKNKDLMEVNYPINFQLEHNRM
jgi:hypothetical protein